MTDSTTNDPDTDEEQKEDLGLGVSRRRYPDLMQMLHTPAEVRCGSCANGSQRVLEEFLKNGYNN